MPWLGTPPASSSQRVSHEWAYRLWCRMDRDGNGYVTRNELECQEFYSILQSVLSPDRGDGKGGRSYGRAQMSMNQAVNFCLRKADLDRDGRLSFEEFKAFMLGLRDGRAVEDLSFVLFDHDANGFIDELEFREVIRFYTGRSATITELAKIWAELDPNDTGKVNQKKYLEWLHRFLATLVRKQTASDQPEPEEEANQDEATEDDEEAEGEVEQEVEAEEVEGGFVERPPSPIPEPEALPWRPWHPYTHLCWAQVGRRAGGAVHISPVGADRGQLSSSATDMRPRTGATLASERPRPKWNNHLGHIDPNWLSKSGRGRRPKSRARATGGMSRPQSLPELRPRTGQTEATARSTARSTAKSTARTARSTPSQAATLEAFGMIPGRSRYMYGRMTNPKTGKRVPWLDNYQPIETIGSKYQPSTIGLRCPGPPPRYMYVDEYYDKGPA